MLKLKPQECVYTVRRIKQREREQDRVRKVDNLCDTPHLFWLCC